ncbi:hypothetical protein [Parvularcula sp. LCG005]|uniref:hypothetical protein n=1 Tax=Parvularcula sp. LCG005 TaxID=3078805 RepID=UPI0029438F7A|nr:hypothetical protein [Parvularcula sp. LCG005]WOI54286.1 hypothetical protein RUI03_04620 [Parvularcula sp. LCG005]
MQQFFSTTYIVFLVLESFGFGIAALFYWSVRPRLFSWQAGKSIVSVCVAVGALLDAVYMRTGAGVILLVVFAMRDGGQLLRLLREEKSAVGVLIRRVIGRG